MPKWTAIVPAATAADDDPDLAAMAVADLMAEPLNVDEIYVVETAELRVYEVGVYQVPR